MKVEVLLSTMYQKDLSIYHKMNIQTDAVIINQCDHNEYVEYKVNGHRVKFVCSTERGLSRSRNMALKYAEGDICLLADDDVFYYDNYAEKIKEQFTKYPEADMLCFCANRKDVNENICQHKYYNRVKKISILTAGGRTSYEIAFRRESISSPILCFDERFGTGSEIFPAGGEETIFCRDCIRYGLSISFIPLYIEEVSIAESTWFKGYDDQYFFDKGAGYTRGMGKYLGLPFILGFCLRKHSLFKKECGIYRAFIKMLKGRKFFLNM